MNAALAGKDACPTSEWPNSRSRVNAAQNNSITLRMRIGLSILLGKQAKNDSRYVVV